jgi:hypothetical protein
MPRKLRLTAVAGIYLVATAQSADHSPVVVKVSAESAVAVGFLPPKSDPFWRSEGAFEHNFHIGDALATIESCLVEKGVVFKRVYADLLELNLGGVQSTLDLRSAGALGVYLAKTQRPPKLLAGSSGTSPLQALVPIIAPRYFDYPECVPEEWRNVCIAGESC